MILTNEKSTENRPWQEFEEWADCFSERLFVTIQVYFDESGTHFSRNNKHGSFAPTFCGFIDTPKNWRRFVKRWDSVLRDYGAPYFHFREFADKNHKNFKKTVYDGWSDEKRRSFLYKLALLASKSAVPCGGAADAKRIHESGLDVDPISEGLTAFFNDLRVKLKRVWPPMKANKSSAS